MRNDKKPNLPTKAPLHRITTSAPSIDYIHLETNVGGREYISIIPNKQQAWKNSCWIDFQRLQYEIRVSS